MGIRVIPDTVDGQSLTEGEDGHERVRTFKVYGLTDRRDPLFQAKTAVDSIDSTIRIPRYGDFHRVIPDIFCRNIEAEHFNVAWNQAKVTCTYSSLSGGGQQGQPLLVDVLINGVSVMKTTNFDARTPDDPNRGGKIMWVYYDVGKRYSADPNNPLRVKLATQVEMEDEFKKATAAKRETSVLREPFETQISASSPIIEFVFIRTGNPWTAWGQFLNTLNADPFQGDPPGTWMWRLITGHSSFIPGKLPTTPLPWRASITVQRSPNGMGFVETGLFRDSRTGKVPADIDDPPGRTLGKGNLFSGPQTGKQGYALFDTLTHKPWGPVGMPDLTNL
jgi:hypothetical protein